MTRPTTYPRWAETTAGVPDANITTPSSGKQDTGWLDAEKPAAESFNWYQNLAYKWIRYLAETASDTYPAVDGYVGSTAGWFADTAGIQVAQTISNGSQWYVPLRIPTGAVINLADISWRVTPGGATHTLTCGFIVARDGVIVAHVSKASSGGVAAETLVGTGGTVSVGAFPYTLVAGDVCAAKFTADGGGGGARQAHWFKREPA